MRRQPAATAVTCFCRSTDLADSISFLRYYAGWADKINGGSFIPLQSKDFVCHTRKEPVGVVAAVRVGETARQKVLRRDFLTRPRVLSLWVGFGFGLSADRGLEFPLVARRSEGRSCACGWMHGRDQEQRKDAFVAPCLLQASGRSSRRRDSVPQTQKLRLRFQGRACVRA